ncbi:hypothetical protein TCAL_14425 [Tigriopus californicus]|uniref:Endonuclease/exonuclease/phosphatase domain-containing protein n=1 Tax=Tigriopus californicus TaxID=6832 RepID=A0A553PLZ4_TIGCA|nr:hypothetical protein TCAL_14425 [Tigriopus californicus]
MVRNRYQPVGGNYATEAEKSQRREERREPASNGHKSYVHSSTRAERQDPNSRFFANPQDRYNRSGKTRLVDDLLSQDNNEPQPAQREVSLINMNLNGKSVMGLTPKYKIRMIEEFLKSFPDVLFFQDAIDLVDLVPVLEDVSDKKLESYFQLANIDEKDRSDIHADVPTASRSMTGIAWNKEKYDGTPLQLEDDRLVEHVDWLKRHDLTIVKLDALQQEGAKEQLPSFVAISWHGSDYSTPLRQRIQQCEELFKFLERMRSNIRKIPILIGGDFNMDMKSFDTEKYPDLMVAPFRPASGAKVKDIKNTFLVTMDSLKITETGYKQHHPEIFSSPFITAKMRQLEQNQSSSDNDLEDSLEQEDQQLNC